MKLLDFLFKWTLKVIQPAEARRMEEDGALALPKIAGALPEDLDYVYIDDRGADLTVFAFSGMDSLFAGRARYEFRNLFRSMEVPCNLVCFRDPRTSAFHVGFDGRTPGIDYYSARVSEIMEQLGATHNVALGSSSGGQAAFAFATRCGMDKVIAFSPAFPHSVYRAPRNVLQSFFSFRNLLREPQAWIETMIVTVAVIWMEDVTAPRARLAEPLKIWDTFGWYEAAGDARPLASVYYGRRSKPDARQAALIAPFPQVTLNPVDTARHNCPAVLLKRRELFKILEAELAPLAGAGTVAPKESTSEP